ncbi:phage regulatory CII family protein [Geoalkalibacter sp.]|uniref:phage regulatory CII family protein n=1 Tax=Geoalkalibacter sp. TaxID=3041440 RepID=UPI00272EB00D|nr:phage regulatory CII family protein [Geoalkalibacter sp.]
MKRKAETYNEAVYAVVHGSGVPIKQLAARAGIAESTLYNCANPNMEEPALARKHIIPLTLATRNFEILDFFEEQCGRVAYELPAADCPLSEIAKEVSTVTRKFGVLLLRVSQALENDGRVDGEELAGIRAAGTALHRGLARLLAVAEREANG